jgi:hypothetical protein
MSDSSKLCLELEPEGIFIPSARLNFRKSYSENLKVKNEEWVKTHSCSEMSDSSELCLELEPEGIFIPSARLNFRKS